MQLDEWSPDFPVRYSLRMLSAALTSYAAAAQTAVVILGLSLRKGRSARGIERFASPTST